MTASAQAVMISRQQAQRSRHLVLAASAAFVTVLASAFGVIYSSHACRQLYAELQALEATQWHLQEDYSRLLLEQSTWASHHRVEKVATAELGMLPPGLERLMVVAP